MIINSNSKKSKEVEYLISPSSINRNQSHIPLYSIQESNSSNRKRLNLNKISEPKIIESKSKICNGESIFERKINHVKDDEFLELNKEHNSFSIPMKNNGINDGFLKTNNYSNTLDLNNNTFSFSFSDKAKNGILK